MRYRCGAKIAKDLSLFLGAALSFGFVGHVSATDMGLSINVSNTNSLSIVLGGEGSDGSVAVDITPHDAAGTFNESGDVTATVITNNRNGYTLNMTRSSAGMSSDDINNTATIDELSSSEDGYTSATFPANKWGYSLKTDETFGNYFGIGDGVELQNSSEITNGTTSTLKFGAKANIDMPAGSYSTTINFTAVGKVDSRLYMQDVAQWQSRLAINESVIATDLRDMKEYWVTRLETDPDIPDGRADCTGEGANRVCTQIWMTQNLDLDLDTETTFTHANTDLGWTDGNTDTVWTPQSATMPYAINVGSENFILSPERSMDLADGGPAYIMDSTYNSLEACTANNIYTEDDCRHYSSGNLYNYYAAAALGATSNNVIIPTSDTDYSIMPNSICPSGWRLPAGLTAADEYSDYDYLFYQNNVTSSHGGASVKLYYIAYGFDHLKTSPLWFNRPGLFQSSNTTWRNTAGFYWTNSVYNYSTAYELVFDSSDITPANAGSSRQSGFSVRCVARPYEPEPLSMQEITAETCPTEPTTVVDSRDGEEYTIQKLADGNCWLLDNLRLDLTDQDVQAVLSSDNTNASDTTLGYLKNGGGTTSDQYATAGVSSVGSGNIYSTPLINVADKDTTGTGGYESGKYGVYYNYCAASAGSYCYDGANNGGVSSGDAMEDICPKGWRMPTGGSSGEYQALYIAYGSTETDFVNALHTPLAGYSGIAQGTLGFFWSSVRYDNEMMHNLHTGISDVDPATGRGSRNAEGSVRCILK